MARKKGIRRRKYWRYRCKICQRPKSPLGGSATCQLCQAILNRTENDDYRILRLVEHNPDEAIQREARIRVYERLASQRLPLFTGEELPSLLTEAEIDVRLDGVHAAFRGPFRRDVEGAR